MPHLATSSMFYFKALKLKVRNSCLIPVSHVFAVHVAKKQQRFGLRNKMPFFLSVSINTSRVRKTLLPKVYDLLDQTIEAAQSVTYSSLMKANYAVDPLICILCGNEMRLSGFTNSTPLWQLRQHHEKLAKMKQVRL
ncbi:transposase (plasmid) [Piscirickettsia salmonis]|uniref:Transposase n=2 Tax=Piscirickettsia salmonis TaxID=1238 RepID=A0AAC8VKS2_PISSA|nr:transposase [Piscirickettsia salmonis]